MTTKDGGPAFPMPYSADSEYVGISKTHAHYGMTLRDWFAGQALAGCLACETWSYGPEETATYCYDAADALLAEREKDGGV